MLLPQTVQLFIMGRSPFLEPCTTARRTCALRDLPLPPFPGAPPGGVAPHGVAGDAAVVPELPRDLHGAVDRLLGLTALRVT